MHTNSVHYWGEPERAPHKRYSCARIIYYILLLLLLLWYVGHAKLYPQHGSMSINAKYSIAHSWICVHASLHNLCLFQSHILRSAAQARPKQAMHVSSIIAT